MPTAGYGPAVGTPIAPAVLSTVGVAMAGQGGPSGYDVPVAIAVPPLSDVIITDNFGGAAPTPFTAVNPSTVQFSAGTYLLIGAVLLLIFFLLVR